MNSTCNVVAVWARYSVCWLFGHGSFCWDPDCLTKNSLGAFLVSRGNCVTALQICYLIGCFFRLGMQVCERLLERKDSFGSKPCIVEHANSQKTNWQTSKSFSTSAITTTTAVPSSSSYSPTAPTCTHSAHGLGGIKTPTAISTVVSRPPGTLLGLCIFGCWRLSWCLSREKGLRTWRLLVSERCLIGWRLRCGNLFG